MGALFYKMQDGTVVPVGGKGPAGADGAQGPPGSDGPQGPPGPTAVSADGGNIATLGGDSLLYVAMPTAADVGADASGTAASAVSAHEAAADPHPNYLTAAEAPQPGTSLPLQSTSNSAAVGTSLLYSREDHKHQVPTAAPVALGPSASIGVGSSLSRADHVHPYPTAANVGADPAGTAASAVSSHEGAVDPHSGYILANGTRAFDGDVTVNAAGVIVDSAGTAYVALDKGAASNYGQFEFRTAGVQKFVVGTIPGDNLAISVAGVGSAIEVDTSARATVLEPTSAGHIATKGYADGLITTHEAAADPHTGYQLESARGAANGYASLDASTKVPIAQIPTGTSGTTVALGNHSHSGVYDPAGTASSAVSAHEGAADPHPIYLTSAEGDAAYAPLAHGSHVDLASTTPAGLTPDIAGAVGNGTTAARSNHVHNVPAAAPTTNLSASTSNSEGTGSSFARNDHSHAITANVAPSADNATAVVGTSAALARADHRHPFPTAANVGADPAGTAASAVATHEGAADPHPQYAVTVSTTRPGSPFVGQIWAPAP